MRPGLGIGLADLGRTLPDGPDHEAHLDDRERAVDQGEGDEGDEHLEARHVRRHGRGGRSRLKTIHGCRPISVKIQPTIMAASESGKLQIAAFQIHDCRGIRPLRVSQRPTTATSTWSMPSPIIQRNAQ
jgi:hypothetical protein